MCIIYISSHSTGCTVWSPFILKQECTTPLIKSTMFYLCMYDESTLEQWVWLSRTSPRGHWWLYRCKRWRPLGQQRLRPGCSGHLPRTLSALWVTLPQALHHTATPPLGQGILQGQTDERGEDRGKKVELLKWRALLFFSLLGKFKSGRNSS